MESDLIEGIAGIVSSAVNLYGIEKASSASKKNIKAQQASDATQLKIAQTELQAAQAKAATAPSSGFSLASLTANPTLLIGGGIATLLFIVLILRR
jgi:hypothetical protein